MPAAPIPANEVERISALVRCQVLDTRPEAAFDDLTQLASELCDVPTALISLVDSERQWFKSRVGLDAPETPRNQAFCGYSILSDEPLIIPDASIDPRTFDNPLVTGPPGIRFYCGMPLRLASGEALGTLCVIDYKPRELTAAQLGHLRALARQATSQLELRYLMQELGDATRAAQDANEAKSLFLANMSHEIRTPMTAVLGFADLLGSKESLEENPELIRDAVETIRRNASHLLALLSDILDVSKIEAGKMAIETMAMDPARVIEEVIELVGPRAHERGIGLNVRYEGTIPTTIQSDPTRLRQVLLNLVGNAVKFTQEGSVTVLCRSDPERERMEFRVVDTGVGMTVGQLEKIQLFEAFTQADNSTTRCFGGTGLGIRISHLLTRLLGGEISIDSKRGDGSTFTAVISTGDLTRVDMRDPKDLENSTGLRVCAAEDRLTPDCRALAGCTVLLAEDGRDNQKLITFFLEAVGATVQVANNGREALDLLRSIECESHFDLILMDMQMPEVDGYEATRVLRTLGVSTPVIALTAHAMGGDREKCIGAGCDYFLTKPIHRPDFIELCQSAIAHS